jgi:DNA-binding transcriptional LysR family regulator
MSKAIAQLEVRLCMWLLLRSTRGLTMTEAGEGSMSMQKFDITSADLVEKVVRQASAGLNGGLRVSAAIAFPLRIYCRLWGHPE